MELLAPVGGFEQLRAAVAFGADAVYLAAEKFGMRARAANFTMEELPRAIRFAHDEGVSAYVACNTMIDEDDLAQLPEYLEKIDAFGADALIIGDLGAASLARKHAPCCRIHVSTQASIANSESAKVWHELGASRIVCAREMTLAQIAKMRQEIPADLEIEAFVHGAQCMAISQRCIISSYLAGRSGNKGECAQPCRWNYALMEEKRPNEYFPVEEDSGTFIMNSKDLCMISHIPELRDAGVYSLKIEGRNKKAFYVATVVGAYRLAVDAAEEGRELSQEEMGDLESELASISHRPYGEGFYFGDPKQACGYDGYEQQSLHVADVVSCTDEEDGSFRIGILCRNRIVEGDRLEALSPIRARTSLGCSSLGSGGFSEKPIEPHRELKVEGLQWLPEGGSPVKTDVANRTIENYSLNSPFPIAPGSFLRKRQFVRTGRHL